MDPMGKSDPKSKDPKLGEMQGVRQIFTWIFGGDQTWCDQMVAGFSGISPRHCLGILVTTVTTEMRGFVFHDINTVFEGWW